MRLLAPGAPNTVALTSSSISFNSTPIQLLNFSVVTYVDGSGTDSVSVSGPTPFVWDLGTGSYSLTVDLTANVTLYDPSGNFALVIDGTGSVMINIGESDPAVSPSTPASNSGFIGRIRRPFVRSRSTILAPSTTEALAASYIAFKQ